jgi:hypothetical protein
VAHGDPLVQVWLCHVEHERGTLAEALQTTEQSHGGWSITPPAVGHGADHMVAVDDKDARSVACPTSHHRRFGADLLRGWLCDVEGASFVG